MISQFTFDKYWDFATSWSPDSKKLGFHRYIDGTRNLFIVSLDNNEVTPVFGDSAHDWYATFSFDESLLGFGRSTGIRDEFVVLHRTDTGSWENPEVFGRNTEPAHCTLMPYPDEETALVGTREASPFFQSLNGRLNPSM